MDPNDENSPSPVVATTVFPVRDFDASINLCCWIATVPIIHFGFCPYKTTVLLDQEEVTKTDIGICTRSTSKRPYGELGSVEKSRFCCFVSVKSSFGEIIPGCGCSDQLVDDMVRELKIRQRERGDTAQIRRAEETLGRLDVLEEKIDLILNHLKIEPMKMGMDDR